MTAFIQARNFRAANRTSIRLVVIHTMENPEKPNGAEAVAAWFAGPNAPMASAHLCVDSDSVVECVKPTDIAFAAPGANGDGYHIEHAGRAAQSTDDWHDAYSFAELALSAKAVAPICVRYGIPPYRLDVDDVAGKVKQGFCGHVDVTNAFHKSTHTDPGHSFPWAEYLTMVAEEINALLASGTDGGAIG